MKVPPLEVVLTLEDALKRVLGTSGAAATDVLRVPLPPNRQQFSNILSAARRQLRLVTE